MKTKTAAGFLLAILLCIPGCGPSETRGPLPRTIITTDGEVDDFDSFIRLLLYSNEMDIKALVYTSSKHHWAGDGKGTLLLPANRAGDTRDSFQQPSPEPEASHRWIGLDWMQELIGKYAQVYPNLVRHDDRFPSPDYLESIVKVGNIIVEGDMAAPTEGSEFIKSIILDDDPSPLYIQLWGGTNTVARALLSIEEEYGGSPEWEDLQRKISRKVVLNMIQDQDGTYLNYVAKNWPEIRTIYNKDQFLSFAYLWRSSVPEDFKPYLSGRWFTDNIINGHGPLAGAYLGLGSGYELNDPDDHFWNPELARRMGGEINDFISEGDSPSYLLLFDWGLRSIRNPEWGGLGGRFYKESDNPNVYRDPHPEGGFTLGRQENTDPNVLFDRETGDFNPHKGRADMWYPQARWVKVLQNDFASRADWCVSSYDAANHRPTAKILGGPDIQAKPGETITVKAVIRDPDGDETDCFWWQYREAGTSDCILELGQKGADVTFTIPSDAIPGTTLHIILEVSDDGTPSLTGFQRVIVSIV